MRSKLHRTLLSATDLPTSRAGGTAHLHDATGDLQLRRRRLTARVAPFGQVRLRAQVVELRSKGNYGSRLSGWLPLMLILGGFSLSGLPSLNAALNALSVGLYLSYAALITVLHILPRLALENE